MNNIITTVTLDAVTRRKDKSVTLRFITSLEQSSEEFMEMDKLLDTSGVVYFKPNGELTTKEIEEIDNADLEIEGKTKSQRLRNVLYVYHSQFSKQQEFKDFYSHEMERIIQHYKDKLDE